MREEFSNKIKNEETSINEQIFKEYFSYESLSVLVKNLYESNQNKNDMIVKYLKEPYYMNTIFMKSENRETTEPHRLLLNLADKINLKRNDKYVALPNLNIY